jgi:hypothetical protein
MGWWRIVAGTLLLFDLSAGETAKQTGRRRAEPCRQPLLELAREAVRAAALARGDRLATVDDACLFLPALRRESPDLGSAADSIFKAAEWEFTGEWRPSRLKSKKPRTVRVWRLRW